MKKKEEIRTPGAWIGENSGPDIVWDMNGHAMNAKYPPDVKKYGERFSGYPDYIRETMFYDFAVNNYDVSFKYKGKPYWLAYLVDHVAAYDESVPDTCENYPHANALIENFEIDGHKLIEIIDELEEVQPE